MDLAVIRQPPLSKHAHTLEVDETPTKAFSSDGSTLAVVAQDRPVVRFEGAEAEYAANRAQRYRIDRRERRGRLGALEARDRLTDAARGHDD